MFSFLDVINSWLGYINIEPKTKGRIYDVLSFLGELYMAYITYRFLANGFWARGLLLLVVTVVLAYFLYLNTIYYFTNRTSKIDVTPWIYKILHIKPQPQTQGPKVRNIPANGIYDKRKTMPGKLTSNAPEQQFINQLAAELLQQGLLKDNYEGLSDWELKQRLQHEPRVDAIGQGTLLPYFAMKAENGHHVVYAGLNEAHAQPVGTVTQVGLQSIDQVDANHVQIFLAAAYLTGGKFKQLGRRGVLEQSADYQIELEIASKATN
ncbi:hypothetical protein M3M38_05750 [Fructilactobacillus cliffordii]|uniref:DUF6681 family protein n=1 Tax=Fructilactobacillus cliffordii TaxID=2940299 RepID=UPI002092B491|nr:DUF6681 family protein [Fructilactobacillus cliffordii]USS86198.1 hypothetical protein M3M38_05750 [Fructilactobacillus cliffordii]